MSVCEQKKMALAEHGVIIQWGCACREDGTVHHLEQCQGHWVTGIVASWDDWCEQTRHTCLFTITDTHTHTYTLQVWLKNTITNTVELITFLAISYMSTHAEHLCPPPFIVLLCLILFCGEMIMISLAAKYECKFTSLVPAKTHSVYWSIIIVRRQTGKEHF